MISFSEAKHIIHENVQPLPPVPMPLMDAAGKMVAETVYAPLDLPPFDQAGMDGYAFCFAAYEEQKKLQIKGEVPAGEAQSFLQHGQQAVRIFTGAPVPRGADTVVMQEKVRVEENQLLIEDDALVQGSNLRPKGSEIRKGAVALEKGTLLTPAATGFLASLGQETVLAHPSPSVALLVTGNELQQPGQPLHTGQVYESNSFALRAALQQAGIREVAVTRVPDDLNTLQKALQDALQQCELVLLTGGISAGAYDYVLPAALACGVQPLFHKVKQKPGKPLFFGKWGNKPVFGLPGNPSSVLTCFYEYVLPALGLLTGRNRALAVRHLPLTQAVQKKAGLTHLLKGNCTPHSVSPLGAQESYRLHSFATANCLILLEEEQTAWKEGDLVEVHLLPE